MTIQDIKLDTWFKNLLQKIMKHNDYEENWLDVKTCDSVELWTPCDLIAREYLNNGCGSAKGFLGITPSECEKAYDYMCEHKDYIVEQELINYEARNNFGFPLWKNYEFDR